MNFVGVVVGGISVAYALVELLPAEVLSPPSGAPAECWSPFYLRAILERRQVYRIQVLIASSGL